LFYDKVLSSDILEFFSSYFSFCFFSLLFPSPSGFLSFFSFGTALGSFSFFSLGGAFGSFGFLGFFSGSPFRAYSSFNLAYYSYY